MRKDLKKGILRLKPENPTDLYVLSNIIEPGDTVSGKTTRRIRRAGTESRSGESSQRISLFLTISTVELGFQESSTSQRLRIRGTILEGPEQHVSIGSFHTIVIEAGNTLKVGKSGGWSRYHFNLLDEAAAAATMPKVLAVAIESGMASGALIDNYKVNYVFQERVRIPRKSSTVKGRDQALSKFYASVANLIWRHIDPSVKNIVIGGPGFTKEEFVEILREDSKAERLAINLETCSSGEKTGVEEMIHRGVLDKIATDYRVIQESRILDSFMTMVRIDTDKTSYGFDSCFNASQSGAVESLMILDSFLRGNSSGKTRKLLRNVENTRGKVMIVDGSTENGNRLEGLGGVIAILRYPLYS